MMCLGSNNCCLNIGMLGGLLLFAALANETVGQELDDKANNEMVDGAKMEVHKELHAPRPLLIGGEHLASPDSFAAPALGDVNGDGRLDLFVGDFGRSYDAYESYMEDYNNKDNSSDEDAEDGSPDIFGWMGRVHVCLGDEKESAFGFQTPEIVKTEDGSCAEAPTW